MKSWFMVWMLVYTAYQQTSLVWSIPNSGLEVQTVSLIINQSIAFSPKLTTITFVNSFASTPNIVLSLASAKNVQKSIALFQQSVSRAPSYFIHKLTINDFQKSINLLKICYAAVNLNKFNYFYPHSMIVQPQHLSTSFVPDTEFIEVQYLNQLDSTKTYEIGALLSGFRITANSSTLIGVHAQLYTVTSFLLKVRVMYSKLIQVQFTRFLIDRTIESTQPSGLNQKLINAGQIHHYSIASSSYTPTRIDFFIQASFYGIMEFQKSFQCLVNNSFNLPPSPAADISIGSVVFMERLCPASHPFYEATTQTCFQSCAFRLYQINMIECGLCYGPCYTCTGPTLSECTSYLSVESSLNGTNLTCNPNYMSTNVTQHCQICDSIVLGCKQCQANGSCVSCISGCILMNSTYCNCLSTCSNSNQYIDPHTQLCLCLPQYYEDGNGTCQRCDAGCYICVDAETCTECIDRYELVETSCVFFQHTSYIIDSNEGMISEGSRCMQKIGDNCVNLCDTNSFLYKSKCYIFECPAGSFAIKDIYGNRICQPCPYPCIECDVYYLCKKCDIQGYTLSSTFMCLSCPPGCSACNVPTTCTTCRDGYLLNGSSQCQQQIPPPALYCDIGCAKCVISGYCQQCKQGYYRLGDSQQCTQCLNDGMTLTKYSLINETVVVACEQVCGDGIRIMDECDDGNTESGDGCSDACQVQSGYTCEYMPISRASLCFKASYQLGCQFDKSLTSNKINISLAGIGIHTNSIPFSYSCGNNLKYISQYYTRGKHVYEFQFTSSVQDTVCTFYAKQSVQVEQIICNISSSPPAVYFHQNNFLLKYMELGLGYIYKPLAYIVWTLSIVGADPYDILINHTFIFLYLASLHQFKYQPPNNYVISEQLRYFAMDYMNVDNHERLQQNNEEFMNPIWKMLILFGIVILYHQIIVRFLKLRSVFHQTQVKIFHQIFKYRFIHYICVYVSVSPMFILYSISVLHSQDHAPSSIVVAVLYLTLFIVSCIVLFFVFDHICVVKSHIKYVYLISIINQIVLFSPTGIFYEKDQLFLSAIVAICSFVFFLLMSMFDSSEEVRKQHSKYEDQSQINQSSYSMQENIDGQHGCALVKGTVRKINIFVQFTSFIAICIIRLICYGSDKQSVSYQILGVVISLIFVCGNLVAGITINIISQCITLAIYMKTQLPEEKVEEEHDNQQSRHRIVGEQLSMSEYSRQQ